MTTKRLTSKDLLLEMAGPILYTNQTWQISIFKLGLVCNPIEQWNQHRKISCNDYSIISVDELQRENITNFANENKEFIQKCQKGDKQACGKAVDIAEAIRRILLDFTGLTNPYNFVVQSYSVDDSVTYLSLSNVRLFKLTKGSIPPIAMTNNEKLIPQEIHSCWKE